VGALMRRIWRYAWAAPCTATGLLFAALPLLCGFARARTVDGAIEIALRDASRLARRLPFNAITFGHCVLGLSHAELDRLRRHEHAHVRQYERWGLLFFLAYPLASLWCLLQGRRAYRDNRFEVEAREAERPARRR
jgi:hypothetical protein